MFIIMLIIISSSSIIIIIIIIVIIKLEYRIPRLHSPVNSRRFPEISGDVCKNKTSFLLYVSAENRSLSLAPVDFRGKPEPVARTQVLYDITYDMI